VDIGTELFALCAACAHAQELGTPEAAALADHFAHRAKLKIDGWFAGIRHNADREGYKLAQEIAGGKDAWLEAGIVG